MFRYSGAVGCNEHFAVWFKEELNAFPFVGNQASCSACSFEYTCGGRIAIPRHALAAHIQHRERRAVESVVISSVDVTAVVHVLRQRLVAPPTSTEQKSFLW